MRIVFVRHAETAANAEGRLQGHAEFDLSDIGRAQAEKLYERFQKEGFQPTHVYSSPLRRTAETAQIASRSWPVSITHWNDLKEYDVGIFSGLTWDEIADKFPNVSQEFHNSKDWDFVEGAETLRERSVRAQRVVDMTIKRHTDDDVVLLFTHGGIVQYMLAALMGTDRIWGTPVGNTAVFDFTLDRERWTQGDDGLLNNLYWRIACFNDSSHLSG